MKMSIKQTNIDYWHENCERLNEQYPQHFIAINDGKPVIIEQERDRFRKELETNCYSGDVLSVFAPGLDAILPHNMSLIDFIIDFKSLDELYEAMEKDRQYFLSHKNELFKDYNGRYVAIRDGAVVGHSGKWGDLVEFIDKKNIGRVYIEKVEEDSFRDTEPEDLIIFE